MPSTCMGIRNNAAAHKPSPNAQLFPKKGATETQSKSPCADMPLTCTAPHRIISHPVPGEPP